jgi:hypothetical protein
MHNAPEDDRKDSEIKHITINVDLPAALTRLDRDLQHLVDLVSIGVTGVRKVEESEYKTSPFPSAQQLHKSLPYSDVKDEYVYWSLRNAFTQAIDQVGEFLEECRGLIALYRLGSTTINGDEWNRIWTTERETFDRKPFPQKIAYLEEKSGGTFQFKDHVLTLNQARNCLVHRLGVVSQRDTKGTDSFTVKWHTMRLVIVDSVTGDETFVPQQTPTEHESKLVLRIGPLEKKFQVGDHFLLSPDELNFTMWTFHSFALELLQAIERLGPKQNAGDFQE